MEEFTAQKKPYKGVWIVALFMLAIPIGIFFMSRVLLYRFTPESQFYLVDAEAAAIGGLIGTLVALSFVVAGGMSEATAVMKSRVGEFFSNLGISVGCAFSWWWDDVKSNGVVFWIYLALILCNVGLMALGIRIFIRLYTA